MTRARTKSKALPHTSHEDATVSMFRDDPELAAEYLNQVLADGSRAELLLAMRYLTSAFGGVPAIAQATRLNARTLYRTLSERGNPELETLSALLEAMGLRLAIAPLARAAPKRAPAPARQAREKHAVAPAAPLDRL